jgi:hypothetical protein
MEWRNGRMAELWNGGNGGQMAEWLNGGNGYLPTIFMVHADDDDDKDTDTFKSFIVLKLIFWIVGVVGGYAKKYPTRKAHIRRELVLLLWARKIAQTPNYDTVFDGA